jgi:hypothetical protein
MTEASIAADLRWYRSQPWLRDPEAGPVTMRAIQERVGSPQTGEADAETVRAVARFQEDRGRGTTTRPGRVLLTHFGDLADLQSVREDFQQAGLEPARRGGYAYMGRPSADFTRATVRELIAWAERDDGGFPDLAIGARAYLAACQREGWPSAINTYDNMTLTWGTGFAAPAVFNQVYGRLDAGTQAALSARMDRGPGSGGVTLPLAAPLPASLRSNVRLLEALIRVAEDPDTQADVLRAQVETFLVHTMGIQLAGGGLRFDEAGLLRPSAEQAAGQRYPGVPEGVPAALAAGYLLLGSRLAHAASGFQMPDEVARALALSGDRRDGAGTVAAFMKRFTAIFMRSSRYSQTVSGGQWRRSGNGQLSAKKWNSRLNEYGDNAAPHRLVPSSRSQELIPALTGSSAPYLTGHDSIQSIPSGHWVVEDDGRFYDFGEPI